MTAQQQYTAKTPGFCLSGQIWARKHPWLAESWRACPYGTLMAYWLRCYRNVPREKLRVIAARYIEGDRVFTGAISDRHDRLYANALRRRFTASGRKVKKA